MVGGRRPRRPDRHLRPVGARDARLGQDLRRSRRPDVEAVPTTPACRWSGWGCRPCARRTCRPTSCGRTGSSATAPRRTAPPTSDSFDGFTDAAGRYSPVGPDADGTSAKLRRADGLGFTPRRRPEARELPRARHRPARPRHGGAPAPPTWRTWRSSGARGFDAALDVDVNAQIRREAASRRGPARAARRPTPGSGGRTGAAPHGALRRDRRSTGQPRHPGRRARRGRPEPAASGTRRRLRLAETMTGPAANTA